MSESAQDKLERVTDTIIAVCNGYIGSRNWDRQAARVQVQRLLRDECREPWEVGAAEVGVDRLRACVKGLEWQIKNERQKQLDLQTCYLHRGTRIEELAEECERLSKVISRGITTKDSPTRGPCVGTGKEECNMSDCLCVDCGARLPVFGSEEFQAGRRCYGCLEKRVAELEAEIERLRDVVQVLRDEGADRAYLVGQYDMWIKCAPTEAALKKRRKECNEDLAAFDAETKRLCNLAKTSINE